MAMVVVVSIVLGCWLLGFGLGILVFLSGWTVIWFEIVSDRYADGPESESGFRFDQNLPTLDYLPVPLRKAMFPPGFQEIENREDDNDIQEQIDKRLQRLTRFGNVGRLMDTAYRLKKFVNHFLALAMESFDSPAGMVWLLSEDGKNLEFKLERAPQERASGRFQVVMGSKDTPFPGFLLDLESPLVMESAGDLPAEIRGAGTVLGAVMLVPLRLGGKSLGVLELRHTETGAFQEHDTELVSLLAIHLTLGIVRRRLGERAEMVEDQLFRRTRELATLSVVGQIASSRVEIQRLLQLVLDISVKLTDSLIGILFLQAPHGGRILFQSPVGEGPMNIPEDELYSSVVNAARESRQPVRIPLGHQAYGWRGTDRLIPGHNEAAIMVVPLQARDEHVGEIVLFGPREYTEEEADAISTMGVQAALSFESANLYFELQKRASFLKVLYSLGEAVSRLDDVEVVIGKLLEKLREFAGWPTLWLFVKRPGEKTRWAVFGADSDRASSGSRLSDVLDRQETLEERLSASPSGNLENLVEQSDASGFQTEAADDDLWYDSIRLSGGDHGIIVRNRKTDHPEDVHHVKALVLVAAEMVLATFRDHELRMLTKFKDIVLENITNGILTFDLQGNLTSANRAAETILNGNEPIALKTGWHDVLGGFPPVVEWLEQHLPSPDSSVEREITIPGTSREDIRSLSVAVSPLNDPGGERLGSVFIVRDITEIARMRERMMHVKRVAALGEMAAGVSHEIRNPLGGVKILASYLARELPSEGTHQEMARGILEGLEKLDRIVSEVLEFTRRLELERRPTKPSVILEKVFQAAASRAAMRQVGFEHEVVSDDLLDVDPDRIEQVLLNLILNAIEASPEGGIVKARVAPGTDSGVEITVQDSGPGVPVKDRSRLFDPFFTTKSTGTGLGLAVSYKIIEAHDGQLTFRELPDGGSCFVISLPGVYE